MLRSLETIRKRFGVIVEAVDFCRILTMLLSLIMKTLRLVGAQLLQEPRAHPIVHTLRHSFFSIAIGQLEAMQACIFFAIASRDKQRPRA